jgi:hypothetical protein
MHERFQKKYDKWHGYKVGANCITLARVNYWNHIDEVSIDKVVSEAKKEGFKVFAHSDDFLQVVFESLEDLNRFYSLVVAIE